MIEVWCQVADVASLAPGCQTAVEVEVDGFVIGRTASRQPPRWEDRFPAMGTGRLLTFRVLACGECDSLVGEGGVDLQALLSRQPEGQHTATLLRGAVSVGTLVFAFRPLVSPSSRSASSARMPSSDVLQRQQSPSSSRSPQALGSPVVVASPSQRFCFGLPPRASSGGFGSKGTSRFKAASDPEALQRFSLGAMLGSSPASASTGPAEPKTAQRSSSEQSPGARLNFTAKAHEDLVEIMRSKDKLRHYAERPFKARGVQPGGRLGFGEFCQALKELLQELHMSVPMDAQMQ
ncbi:unnamed protein product, partial [Polarella glacialis]